MVNESDLPQFHAGPETPIGQIINPGGIPVAPKKAASGLLKRIMAMSKPAPKSKGKAPGRAGGRTRGIESNNKVRIGKRKVRFY